MSKTQNYTLNSKGPILMIKFIAPHFVETFLAISESIVGKC